MVYWLGIPGYPNPVGAETSNRRPGQRRSLDSRARSSRRDSKAAGPSDMALMVHGAMTKQQANNVRFL